MAALVAQPRAVAVATWNLQSSSVQFINCLLWGSKRHSASNYSQLSEISLGLSSCGSYGQTNLMPLFHVHSAPGGQSFISEIFKC